MSQFCSGLGAVGLSPRDVPCKTYKVVSPCGHAHASMPCVMSADLAQLDWREKDVKNLVPLLPLCAFGLLFSFFGMELRCLFSSFSPASQSHSPLPPCPLYDAHRPAIVSPLCLGLKA